jgi:hypothetical protein
LTVVELANLLPVPVRARVTVASIDGRPRRWEAGTNGTAFFELVTVLGDDITLWRNPNYWGRAWMVESVLPVSSPAEAQAALRDPSSDVDLRRAAYVVGLAEAPAMLGPGEATIQRYADREVVIATRSAQPSFLVLADRFDPDWRCTVDGTDAPILHTNGFARGVMVAAGEHTVRFWYASNALAVGFALSCLGALLLAGLAWWLRRNLVAPAQEPVASEATA